ncbi:alpha,alpha-phosphotrehalase [Anaerosporobacter sp.]
MSGFSNKVIYQIYPKSFMDSDGDGFGDLKGVTKKLDYLAYLGVDYLWLTPFFVSPQRDNGYDVEDYYNIDPRFGTMEDVENLIAEAKKHGMGVMFDMVFNHTSTAHEWFQKALQGDKEYQDFYYFVDGTEDKIPTNWISKFGGPAWKYVPDLKKWYLHLFDETQADLNWENEKVREELKKVIHFWKDKGVEGFRFDVVNLISKPEVFEDDMIGDGRRFYTDGRHVHEFLKELVADTQMESMVTVGEMSSTTLENCIRYSNPEEKELSMCFNFHHLKIDYKGGDKWEVMDPDIRQLNDLMKHWQEGMQKANGWNAVFWCNHDQPRIVSRLGDEHKYWKESAKMLATSIHMMRGTPYVYQGEEIGMTNAGYSNIEEYKDVESLNYYEIMLDQGKTKEEALKIVGLRSRDNGRTPMQWTDGENAGFSQGTPWIGVNHNSQCINVESQLGDKDSILEYYRRLIALRKEKAVIADGSISFLEESAAEVMAYTRTLGDEELVVFANYSDREVVLNTNIPENSYLLLLDSYTDETSIINRYQEGCLVLRPYESQVWEKVVRN